VETCSKRQDFLADRRQRRSGSTLDLVRPAGVRISTARFPLANRGFGGAVTIDRIESLAQFSASPCAQPAPIDAPMPERPAAAPPHAANEAEARVGRPEVVPFRGPTAFFLFSRPGQAGRRSQIAAPPWPGEHVRFRDNSRASSRRVCRG